MLWNDFRAKCESVGKIYLNSLLRLFVWSNCAIGNYCNWYIVSVFLFQLFNCLLQGLPTFSSSRTTKWSEKCWRTTKIAKKIKTFEYHQICKLMHSCIIVKLNLFRENYFIIFVLQMKKLPLFLFKHCNLSAYHRLGPPGLLYVFAIGILTFVLDCCRNWFWYDLQWIRLQLYPRSGQRSHHEKVGR